MLHLDKRFDYKGVHGEPLGSKIKIVTIVVAKQDDDFEGIQVYLKVVLLSLLYIVSYYEIGIGRSCQLGFESWPS